MGHAAYMRGSRAIAAQFCLDRGCSGCIWCRPEGLKATPRPAGWGGKARERAEACACGMVASANRYGMSEPTLEALALAVETAARVGKATALDAATFALRR